MVNQSSVRSLVNKPALNTDKPLLQIRNVTKKFGEFVAVNNVDLNIYAGELFCLLGGSGCGKSTLLRMLAGFETPSSGQILIDGKDMSGVPPYQRPTNMMFQNYALFPHMSVERNIAFGLEQDGIHKSEIKDRTHNMLRLVELQGYEKRRPNQLSGGQRQRVALARALVKEPKLLLLDEPLGALDKKLREHTQFELMNIQEKVGVTFVVVTHDQEEAMVLATRIAVMDKGQFIQIGSPTEIYEYPENRFVANFIGSANIFEGTILENNNNSLKIATELGEITLEQSSALAVGSSVFLGLRPEKISISKDPSASKDGFTTSGVVEDIGYLGNTSRYKIRLDQGTLVDVTAQNHLRPQNRTHAFSWEEKVTLRWDASNIMLLKK